MVRPGMENADDCAVRRKEHSLKALYTRRSALFRQVPDFWPQVFLNGPEEIQNLYSSIDLPVLTSIKDFSVERYQVISESEGEPRSLRFTFVFDDNDHFDAQTLVKDLEYKASEHGAGNLVSKPVSIKWKNTKKDLTKGCLDLAVELEAAEEAMKLRKGGQEIDLVERESLWQYEKLRRNIQKMDEDKSEDASFLNWFGFRGAVDESEKPAENGSKGDEAADEEEDEEDIDRVLDVEIFPPGEEIAICLAEDLFPNVMDYYMRSQRDDVSELNGLDQDIDEDSDEDDDVEPPELIHDTEVAAEKDARPKKRQRRD